jgi:cysteine synthase
MNGSAVSSRFQPANPVRSALDLIGNTPLVELPGALENRRVRIYGKLEWYNPCGSIKDRPARQMIEDAISSRALRPGMRVIEATSGNTGTGLAFVCKVLGFPLTIVSPKIATQRKREDMERFGAEIIDVEGDTTETALAHTYELVEQHPEIYFHTDQFTNTSNSRAHELTTGPEILADCPEVTDIVASVGSFGTISGIGTYFQKKGIPMRMHAVRAHPGDAFIAGMKEGDKHVPLMEKFADLDVEWRMARGRSAVSQIQRALALGYHIGPSAALVLHAALQIGAEMDRGHIVCVFADGGGKYPGNPLYDPQRAAAMSDAELNRKVFCSQ